MQRVLSFVYLSVVFLALSGAGFLALDKPSGVALEADGVETYGLEVYQAQGCGACHQLAAAGTKGVSGPPHDALGVIAGARLQDPNYHGTATNAEAYIRESIVDPKAYLVPGYGLSYHHMPAYTTLGEVDLDALVKMLLAQTGAQR